MDVNEKAPVYPLAFRYTARIRRRAYSPNGSGVYATSSTRTHPFITPFYWQESLPSVRDDYLPAARTWVAERESALAGFISMLRDKVVGALMALSQQAYPALTLEVYRLNRYACRFYHHRGFIPIAQRLNAETGHLILTLHWRADGIMHSSTPPPHEPATDSAIVL